MPKRRGKVKLFVELSDDFTNAPLPLAAYSAASGTFPPPVGGGTNSYALLSAGLLGRSGGS